MSMPISNAVATPNLAHASSANAAPERGLMARVHTLGARISQLGSAMRFSFACCGRGVPAVTEGALPEVVRQQSPASEESKESGSEESVDVEFTLNRRKSSSDSSLVLSELWVLPPPAHTGRIGDHWDYVEELQKRHEELGEPRVYMPGPDPDQELPPGDWRRSEIGATMHYISQCISNEVLIGDDGNPIRD